MKFVHFIYLLSQSEQQKKWSFMHIKIESLPTGRKFYAWSNSWNYIGPPILHASVFHLQTLFAKNDVLKNIFSVKASRSRVRKFVSRSRRQFYNSSSSSGATPNMHWRLINALHSPQGACKLHTGEFKLHTRSGEMHTHCTHSISLRKLHTHVFSTHFSPVYTAYTWIYTLIYWS